MQRQPSIESNEIQPWKLSFRVSFKNKLGLAFEGVLNPDTGNGVYSVMVKSLPKGKNGKMLAAEKYNEQLSAENQHLKIQPGYRIASIERESMLNVEKEIVLERLDKATFPVEIKFVNVDAGYLATSPREFTDKFSDKVCAFPTDASVLLTSVAPQSTPKKQLPEQKFCCCFPNA